MVWVKGGLADCGGVRNRCIGLLLITIRGHGRRMVIVIAIDQ